MISGQPRSTVLYDTEYSFRPNVWGTNDDTLTFSVENLPPWAAFDASSGRVHGVPGMGDLGTYRNIRIRASDGERTAALASFSIEVVATGTGSATLSWTPPTENEDGTPLGDLAGFKVYWGTSRNRFLHSVTIDNPGLTTYVVDQLTPAKWYFVATAFDARGAESRFSNVASKKIR